MNVSGARLLMGESQGRYDGHCHVFRTDLPMIPERRYTPAYDARPETLNALLNEHSLDGALLIQPSFLGSDNQYLLDTICKFKRLEPKRVFKGVAVLDPALRWKDEDLCQLSAQGVIGLRLNLYRHAERFDYVKWQPLLLKAEKQGWHIEVHCEANMLPLILPPLVKNHSKIVIDHFGLVTSLEQCSGMKTILSLPPEKLWIKMSAPYRLKQHFSTNNEQPHDEILRALYKVYSSFIGDDRLVWGSDWPFTQFEDDISYDDMVRMNCHVATDRTAFNS